MREEENEGQGGAAVRNAAMIAPSTTNEPRGPNRAGLPWPVAALLALLFVVLAATITAGLWLRHEDLLRQGEDTARNLAEILSEHLAVRFATIEGALTELAAYNRRFGGPASSGEGWMAVLNVARGGLEGVESVAVTDSGGRTTYSTNPETMQRSWADRPIYRALSGNPMSDALVADTPTRSTTHREMLLPVGRVLRTINGEFEGMLIATLMPGSLRDFYRSVDVGSNGVVWVLTANGDKLLREPDDDPLGGVSPALPLAESEAQGVSPSPIEPGGLDYVTASRPAGGTGLVVAVSLAANDLLAPWRRDVLAAAALIAITGVLLLITAFAIRRRRGGQW